MDWVRELLSAGSAGAVIVVVVMFLKHQRQVATDYESSFRDIRRECAQCRSEHAVVIENHILHNTKIQGELASEIRELRLAITLLKK